MKPGETEGVGDDCKAGESLLSRLQDANPYPLSVMIVLTERCNLSCPHCYVPQPAAGAVDLETDEVITLLDELAAAGVIQLTISGGEPGTRSDLVEIIEAALKRRFNVSLKTNAAALTMEQLERMREAGLPELSVSLYSDRAEDHDRFVGMRGAWKRTWEAAQRFHEFGGRVRVGIVMMNWNADRILALERLCDDEGWYASIDPRIDVRIDGNSAPAAFRPDLKDVERVAKKSAFYGRLVGIEKKQVPDEARICGIGRNTACIQANGDVWPCVVLPITLGNVRERPFREIWDDSEVRRQLREVRWGDAEQCRGCTFSPDCDRCPGTSYLERGDMAAPAEMDCVMAELKYRLRTGQGRDEK